LKVFANVVDNAEGLKLRA